MATYKTLTGQPKQIKELRSALVRRRIPFLTGRHAATSIDLSWDVWCDSSELILGLLSAIRFGVEI